MEDVCSEALQRRERASCLGNFGLLNKRNRRAELGSIGISV
jgi:hypothetical protein